MKVIICTYYAAPNYGAFLQAFALSEYIKQLGINTEIKKHKANEKNIITALCQKRRTPEEQMYKKKMKENIEKYLSFFDFNSGNNHYDLCIIGSDEIWNVRSLNSRHYPFFFKGLNCAEKSIAYAACSGKTSVKDLRLFPYALPGLRKLSAIAVRDEYTENLIKTIGRIDAIRVLDPTFLYNFDAYINEVPYDKYILIYTYGLSQSIICSILKFAHERGLTVIATGSWCPWADQNPIPDPFEWVSLVDKCDYAIMSTFHGLALAIQRKKNFGVINTSHKIGSLLHQLNLNGQIIYDADSIATVLEKDIDYINVNILLSDQIEKSKRYLKNAIGLCNRV